MQRCLRTLHTPVAPSCPATGVSSYAFRVTACWRYSGTPIVAACEDRSLARAAERESIVASALGKRFGALALGTTAMLKPSLAASLNRSCPRGAGNTSPARPTSSKATNPRGGARPRRLPWIASNTARSAAGSAMRTPRPRH